MWRCHILHIAMFAVVCAKTLSVSVSLFVMSGRPVPGWSHHPNVLKQSHPLVDSLNHAPLRKWKWSAKGTFLHVETPITLQTGHQKCCNHGESSGVSNTMEYVLLIFLNLTMSSYSTKFLAVAFCGHKDGNSYPPATIHKLLSGLYCYSRWPSLWLRHRQWPSPMLHMFTHVVKWTTVIYTFNMFTS